MRHAMLKRSGKHESGEGSPLTFPKELLPFVLNAPLPVLVRSTLEWMLKQATLDELFVSAQFQAPIGPR
jgi:hypothetical protein